jgi:hypothetical protein
MSNNARAEALKQLDGARQYMGRGVAWYMTSEDESLDRVVYRGVTQVVTERSEAMAMLSQARVILTFWRSILEAPAPLPRGESSYLRDERAVGADCDRLVSTPAPLYVVRYLTHAKRSGATMLYFTTLANALAELALVSVEHGINPALNGISKALAKCSRELTGPPPPG